MNDFFLQANHIVKRYAAHTALNDVSISVPRGKVFGLLGPNGAGKTTLIRIINRITAPDSGEVLYDGHTYSADDVMRIGYLPEERGLYKKMKVGEQAIYLAQLKGLPKSEAIIRLKTWFEKFGIMPVEQKARRAVEGHAAKGAIYHYRAARTAIAHIRRAILGFRPRKCRNAQK